METIAELGAWNWMILAAILFVLELTAPGIFFMWFGLAAVATGLIAFGFDIGWQWQLVWFCLLSVAFVVLAWKYLREYPLESERPLLNERAVQHIGEQHDLDRSDRERARQRQDRRFDLAGDRARAALGRAGQSGRRRRNATQGRSGGSGRRGLSARCHTSISSTAVISSGTSAEASACGQSP